jgi:hypothetical protein
MEGVYLTVMETVTNNPGAFIRWPRQSILLLPSAARDRKYHDYPPDVKAALKRARIVPDSRSNGPAICAFLLGGGERPIRETGTGWNIHHIYDGKFPFPGTFRTIHAVKHPEYFTHSAGLVALHPIADALADEFRDFAWWLRRQAFDRFAFDPDHVFTTHQETQP